MHWCDVQQAKGWESLEENVRRWKAAAKPQWSEADIEEAAQYLNDTIYRYRFPTGRGRESFSTWNPSPSRQFQASSLQCETLLAESKRVA
jgi:hypothetical protein